MASRDIGQRQIMWHHGHWGTGGLLRGRAIDLEHRAESGRENWAERVVHVVRTAWGRGAGWTEKRLLQGVTVRNRGEKQKESSLGTQGDQLVWVYLALSWH